MIPNVLSIAGSDPSGGAGIQADIKAISANGAFAMAAITAMTVQNTRGVRDICLVPPRFVHGQIQAVFEDIHVHTVKIGMIADAQIAHAVAEALAGQDIPIVLDPVMIAKGGASLLDLNAIAVVREVLLPMATVLTPNLLEAAQLLSTGAATTRTDMETQGRALLAMGPAAVLVKGGHLSGDDCPDCLVTTDSCVWFESARIATQKTHGTGCTLSSALAAQIAHLGDLPSATAVAKSYVTSAIDQADDLNVGSGHGPTHHFAGFYTPSQEINS